MEIVLKPSSLSFPASPGELFAREAPLFVEIGVGSGGFIDDLAGRYPEINVLGVDRAPQSIARSFRRLRSSSREHARLITADARFVIRNVLPKGGIQRAYVNYPDPWPRRKHQHRRLLQKPFLRLLASRLPDDGKVLVTTDHEGYFDFVLKNAADLYDVRTGDPPPEVLATKWARKGESAYHAALSPRPNIELEAFEVDVELTKQMYHAVLQGELPPLGPLEKHAIQHRHGTAVLMEAYRMLEVEGFAFLVRVEEHALSQEVIVEVREGKNGWVVGLKRFGEPLHTRGVGEAVRHVAEWLEAKGMTIIHRKY